MKYSWNTSLSAHLILDVPLYKEPSLSMISANILHERKCQTRANQTEAVSKLLSGHTSLACFLHACSTRGGCSPHRGPGCWITVVLGMQLYHHQQPTVPQHLPNLVAQSQWEESELHMMSHVFLCSSGQFSSSRSVCSHPVTHSAHHLWVSDCTDTA